MELQSDRKEKYLFIETFGCQMNENDSERIIGLLRHLNYKVTDNPDMADMVILNTCSIRSKAEQKVYRALGRLKRLKSTKPGLIVGVGGCVAQQQGERLLRRVPHLDVVFGTHNIYRLPELVKEVEVKKTKVAATGFSDSIDEGSFEYIYTAKWTEGSLPRVKAAVTIMQGEVYKKGPFHNIASKGYVRRAYGTFWARGKVVQAYTPAASVRFQ